MSQWNIAAAQYAGLHHSVDEHVAHHLRFIAERHDSSAICWYSRSSH